MNIKEVRFLFDYTEWANHLILDAASKVSEEELKREVGVSHRSLFGSLVHMTGAEWIWLERWRGASPQVLWSESDFPALEDLRTRWSQIEIERREFLSGLSDFGLARELHYTNTKGQEFSYSLIRLMQHLVNHSTLHRGQVVAMLRQLGYEPPATDLLFYLPLAK
ncbi:MAG: DinB family protein [Acidobacteriota bacterium]